MLEQSGLILFIIIDDVTYGALDSAEDLTDDAVIRLAKAFPTPNYVQLQDTSGLGDQALTALFKSCPRFSGLDYISNIVR